MRICIGDWVLESTYNRRGKFTARVQAYEYAIDTGYLYMVDL